MDPVKIIAVVAVGAAAFGVLAVLGAPTGAAVLLGAVAAIATAAVLTRRR